MSLPSSIEVIEASCIFAELRRGVEAWSPLRSGFGGRGRPADPPFRCAPIRVSVSWCFYTCGSGRVFQNIPLCVLESLRSCMTPSINTLNGWFTPPINRRVTTQPMFLIGYPYPCCTHLWPSRLTHLPSVTPKRVGGVSLGRGVYSAWSNLSVASAR